MRHLTEEALARLADEPATADETAHLEGCGECRRELDALRVQVEETRSLGTLRAPASGWPRLERSLRAEGLLGGGRGASGWARALPKMAAAIALFVAGGLTGGIVRGPAGPPSTPAAPVASNTVEAERALLASEAAYVAALARYAELTGEGSADDPINRLAALEGIMLTTRAALKEAPADPVINGYHLTAMTQREAMLRQIADEREPGNVWY